LTHVVTDVVPFTIRIATQPSVIRLKKGRWSQRRLTVYDSELVRGSNW